MIAIPLGILPAMAASPPGAGSASGAFAASASAGKAYAACVETDMTAAIVCAEQRCRDLAGQPAGDSGDVAAGCQLVAACMPAGWSGAMGATLGEFHFANTICGAPSRSAVIEALTAYCRGHLPQVLECVIVSLWSPDGAAEDVEILITPADMIEGRRGE